MRFVKLKRWATILRCVLFHKKVVQEFRDVGIFTVDSGFYKGCIKCDLWRKIGS